MTREFGFICLMSMGFCFMGCASSAPLPADRDANEVAESMKDGSPEEEAQGSIALVQSAPPAPPPPHAGRASKGVTQKEEEISCLERGEMQACEAFLNRGEEGGGARARILNVVCQSERATAHVASCLDLAANQAARGERGVSRRLYGKLCEIRSGEVPDVRCLSHARQALRGGDVETARTLGVALCEAEHWSACTFLGVIVEEHDEDASAARARYEEAVEGGEEREALWRLGDVHMWGKGGVRQDKVLAFQMFERSCDGGSLVGCVRLGRMWQFGQGVESRDFERARGFYARACEGGHGEGCVALGHLYEAGLTSEGEKMEQAVTLYEKGCRQGVLQGCVDLGFMHERGRGTARDVKAARALYDEACRKGERDGCHRLLDQQSR